MLTLTAAITLARRAARAAEQAEFERRDDPEARRVLAQALRKIADDLAPGTGPNRTREGGERLWKN